MKYFNHNFHNTKYIISEITHSDQSFDSHHCLTMASNIIIPYSTKVAESSEKMETIKWSHGNSKYEIHTMLLKSIELKDLLPHCLDVRNKINTVVSTEAHRAPSFYRVFPRTLSIVLRAVWDQLITESQEDDELDGNETSENFDQRLCEFIAAHATPEDRYDLVQQLRTAKKPRSITVQAFWYRLREINTYIVWLPGNEPPLTEPQQKQAFYDSMPPKWQE